MSDKKPRNEATRNTILDRLVGSVPEQYRQEMSRVAGLIRDRLPPVMIERRIDALQRRFDERLGVIEAKVETILQLLEKRPG